MTLLNIKRKLYTFSYKVEDDILSLNNEYTNTSIIRNIRNSQLIEHQSGNRINGNLVIKLDKNKVVGITLKHLDKFARHYNFKCTICFDSEKVQVGDPCLDCGGSGCSKCRDGLVFKEINCPNCVKSKLRVNNYERSNKDDVKRGRSNYNGRPVLRKTCRDSRSKVSQRIK